MRGKIKYGSTCQTANVNRENLANHQPGHGTKTDGEREHVKNDHRNRQVGINACLIFPIEVVPSI